MLDSRLVTLARGITSVGGGLSWRRERCEAQQGSEERCLRQSTCSRSKVHSQLPFHDLPGRPGISHVRMPVGGRKDHPDVLPHRVTFRGHPPMMTTAEGDVKRILGMPCGRSLDPRIRPDEKAALPGGGHAVRRPLVSGSHGSITKLLSASCQICDPIPRTCGLPSRLSSTVTFV